VVKSILKTKKREQDNEITFSGSSDAITEQSEDDQRKNAVEK
jgi:hypothetical protein